MPVEPASGGVPVSGDIRAEGWQERGAKIPQKRPLRAEGCSFVACKSVAFGV